MKCLQNVEFDDFMFSECIYPSFTTGNAVVSLHGLMGAAKLRAGVRVRALNLFGAYLGDHTILLQ